jgi:hypothetical protein
MRASPDVANYFDLNVQYNFNFMLPKYFNSKKTTTPECGEGAGKLINRQNQLKKKKRRR